MGDALKRDTFAGGFIIELLFSEEEHLHLCVDRNKLVTTEM